MAEEDSQHNGIHRFFISKNAKVRYEENMLELEKESENESSIHRLYIEMAENSYMEMDTVQIKGADSTKRDSKAVSVAKMQVFRS